MTDNTEDQVKQADGTAGELERLLRQVIRSTECHLDGHDLLAELHPRRTLDIKRRADGRETWFEGDWLSRVYEAVREAREFLDGPHFVTVTACDWNGYSFDGMPFEPFPQWLQMALRNRKIEMYRDSRDYAVWIVETTGGRLLAYPGDTIHNVNGSLVLAQDAGNMSEPRIPDPGRVFSQVQSMGSTMGTPTPPSTPER